ncbi:hypothetical protein NQ318_002621 [Aromia moschata]|uniref:Uncharacterized protein n=1 Tax=Aromia moschata TaxID=1265417 RepID=A0AAV8Y7Y0_9CUCU|nr:hypothetical protein NQ318_002621 [Aromia moschata]
MFLEKYMDIKIPRENEATDACGRSVANFLIGALKSDTASDSHPNLPWEPCLNTDVCWKYMIQRIPKMPQFYCHNDNIDYNDNI